jgi:glucosyl-3-phosphoglycerate synthase
MPEYATVTDEDVDERAKRWFADRTSDSADWALSAILDAKASRGDRVSVVIPARDEERSIGEVVRCIRTALMDDVALVDELVVMDSLSTDDTAAAARRSGAVVWSVADVRPELGLLAGKGEALWKSQFVTQGSVLVFVDADLTEWGTHFVTGLLGPLLHDTNVLLVKGFYDRVLDVESATPSLDGGRVTELVARPLLAMSWPELSGVVQPLAGEWAIRRELFESLSVPVGYGVEFATLVDTWSEHGLNAIAQVDLGRRGHRHQNVHDLGLMAAEILAIAATRSGLSARTEVELAQFDRAEAGQWRTRAVPTWERPPAAGTARPC